MRGDPYSSRVRELFNAPAHAGCVAGGLSAHIEDQGVRIHLSAVCAGGEIVALGFQVWGCPHLIAAAEAFCAGYEHRPARDLLAFSSVELMQSLSVPVEKTGRILVLEDAVRSLGGIVRDASKPEH